MLCKGHFLFLSGLAGFFFFLISSYLQCNTVIIMTPNYFGHNNRKAEEIFLSLLSAT